MEHKTLFRGGVTFFSFFAILWVICAVMGVVLTGLAIYILYQAAIYLDHLNQLPH